MLARLLHICMADVVEICERVNTVLDNCDELTEIIAAAGYHKKFIL